MPVPRSTTLAEKPYQMVWASYRTSDRATTDHRAIDEDLGHPWLNLVQQLRLGALPRQRGNCYDDPEPWFEERPRSTEGRELTALAVELCQTCPIQLECLRIGLREGTGTWGGMSAPKRRKLRRQEAAGTSHDD